MTTGVVALVVAAAILAPTAGYAFRHRDVRGAVWYAVLLLAVAFWCAAYALELTADDVEVKLLLQKIKYVGIVTIPVAWLGFILDFLGREPQLVSQVTRSLIPVSAAILALAWTNDVHGLFWGRMTLVRSGELSVLSGRGPGFWVNIVYVYLAVWAGIGVLVAQAFRQPYFYRKRVAVLILSAVLPWLGNVMFLASHPSQQILDPAPLLFAASALASSVALFRYGVLQPVPTLRDARIAVIGDGLIVLDRTAAVVDMNRRAERILGRQRADVAGHPVADLIPGIEWREQGEWRQDLRLPGQGGDRIYDVSVAPMRTQRRRLTGYVVVLHDVTERRDLEEQLRQAQKMEAVGKLAGGVAHDFNNLLTAILGHAEMAQGDVGSNESARGNIAEITRAASRAADLTRQLLAFARRQIIEPRIVDLNGLVVNVDRLLRRLLGEDIELVTVLDPELWRVKIDPGQFEQVLVNLVVNARDAMPTGGTLVIETRNVHLDEEFARQHATVQPGPHVLLAVSDTGTGMDEEVLAHIFEPFFTTKEVGKGTGLGLATCYGIVKQNKGSIWVHSEKGVGTTFRIYLPRAEGAAAPLDAGEARTVEQTPRGSETVLLVEDELLVRNLAADALRQHGYEVLAASTGLEALDLAMQTPKPVDVLVTDVVMPQMGGPQLAERLLAERPGLKVLFISGYSDMALTRQGRLLPGTALLQKPFTPGQLVRRVRELLDSTNAGPEQVRLPLA